MTPLGTETTTPLRPPAQIMRLDRLGALHQCRLSFARQLTRRAAAEGWRVTRTAWSVDANGNGQAAYTVDTGPRRYTLVAFARADKARFALCDGTATHADIARLTAALTDPEIGRVSAGELCVARARRIDAAWDHVVARLAAGLQPDPDRIASAGALMEVRKVHTSGKFGTADRDLIVDRPEMHAPFQAELLTLWLIRMFAHDLVGHLADQRARTDGGVTPAATLSPATSRTLGVRLCVGLGFAEMAISHPCLFNTWIMAREVAIARIAALPHPRAGDRTQLAKALEAQRAALARTPVTDPDQRARNIALGADLDRLTAQLDRAEDVPRPWGRMMGWAAGALGPEAQEVLASLMLEPYGDLVDGLGHCMSDTLDDDFRIDGTLPVGQMRALIEDSYGWALALDWSHDDTTALTWSMPQDERDPRLGPRVGRLGDPYELPLAAGRDAVRAWHKLAAYPAEMPIAPVLLDHPEHRSAIRRAQITAFAPYAEIRENLIGRDARPVDLLRATLSFLGATDFDPVSDRQMRCRLFVGAPCLSALDPATADLWVYPGPTP